LEHIIIKHYMCSLDGDYRDINIGKLQHLSKKMKRYAENCGKNLIYITTANPELEGLPIDSDSFAEIEYTNELTEIEKKQYTSFLMKMSMNEEYSSRYNREKLHCTLKAIRFKRIADEILFFDDLHSK